MKIGTPTNTTGSSGDDKELFKAYLQAIDVNIISSITDPKGKIIDANSRFCEVSKYSKEELIGKDHRIINSGNHSKEFFSEMWDTISSGKLWHGEILNKAKDGSLYWVETVIIPVMKDGIITRFLSLRLLITEKKKAEQQQNEYNWRLRQMLQMTSHRLRSPLATCLGLMNLMDQGKELKPEERQELITHMRESAHRLDQFTHELTEFIVELKKKYNQQSSSTHN